MLEECKTLQRTEKKVKVKRCSARGGNERRQQRTKQLGVTQCIQTQRT